MARKFARDEIGVIGPVANPSVVFRLSPLPQKTCNAKQRLEHDRIRHAGLLPLPPASLPGIRQT